MDVILYTTWKEWMKAEFTSIHWKGGEEVESIKCGRAHFVLNLCWWWITKDDNPKPNQCKCICILAKVKLRLHIKGYDCDGIVEWLLCSGWVGIQYSMFWIFPPTYPNYFCNPLLHIQWILGLFCRAKADRTWKWPLHCCL